MPEWAWKSSCSFRGAGLAPQGSLELSRILGAKEKDSATENTRGKKPVDQARSALPAWQEDGAGFQESGGIVSPPVTEQTG